MRILLVVSQDEEIGGVASVVGNLAKYMASQGHQVFFLHSARTVFLRQKRTKLGFPGFDFRMQMPLGDRHPAISLLAFLILFPIGMFELIRLIWKHRIQIINIHYPTDCFFYFAVCKRVLPVGLIISVHGADIFPQVPSSRAFKFLLSSSDLIVAPSQWLQRKFLAVFPDLNGKTIFIHNGVNLAELNGLCGEGSADNNVSYILCVSAYKEQKAIDVLIRAFKMVHSADPSLKLVLVGDGPLRGQLEDLAMSLGIQDQIEFHGPKERAEVAKLLRGCKVFALPSRFETFGIVILEAMACKKPVIATTAGGIPEIIEDGKNGILVEPDNPKALADALITVLKDQTLWLDIATRGYVTVHERFRSEDTGSAYESVFADLLNLGGNSLIGNPG
jgi:glycosyltransferase involved in cell wall biosynthesis